MLKRSWAFQRTVRGTDAADVYLRGELAPQTKAAFQSSAGIQLLTAVCAQWLWCSHGFAPFVSQSCSCPDYFTVMNIENYKKQLEKFFFFFCLIEWICTSVGTEVEFLDASCCVLG